MKNIKKLALFCLTLAATATLSVGCEFLLEDNSSSDSQTSESSFSSDSESSNSASSSSENGENSENDSSSSGNDSSNDSSSTGSDSSDNDSSSVEDKEDPDHPDTYPADGNCEFGEWELVTEADCSRKGLKARYCIAHGEEHIDYETFAARGHEFDSKAICATCKEELTLPTANANATYVNPTDANSGILGTGHDYPQYRPVGEDEVELIPNSGRYQFSVGGYYEVEIGNEGTCWFEFAIPEAGQYAVVSTSNADDVTIEQYAASIATLYSIGEGRTLADGNFVSVASCSTLHWNEEWRGTFCLSGAAGDTVKLFIVKVASPAWRPEYITVDVTATQLKGVAPEGAEGTTPTDVPYESEYFYDAECGYYRMGTKENPGEIIYAAITANAVRLMGEMSFKGLPEAGASLNMDGGTNAEGNYVVYNYAPFLCSDPYYGGTANSYQAFVNSKGLYPVTQELYQFLKIYVANNAPITPPDEANADNAWLAACYYYKLLTLGSAGNPIKISELGAYTARQYDINEPIYYTFTYNPNPDATGTVTTYCAFTCSAENVFVWIGETRYTTRDGALNIPFQTDSKQGVTFRLMTTETQIVDMDFKIELLEGSADKPFVLTTLGEVTLQPIGIMMISGSTNYEAYYSYTATETGVLTLTTTSTAQLLLGESVVENGSASVSVAAGETVTVYVSATSADPVNVNLAFTAAA